MRVSWRCADRAVPVTRHSDRPGCVPAQAPAARGREATAVPPGPSGREPHTIRATQGGRKSEQTCTDETGTVEVVPREPRSRRLASRTSRIHSQMSRARRPLLVIAWLLAVAGCVTTPPDRPPAAWASDVLRRAIGDSTQPVGFTIGAGVLLPEGRYTRQRRLFPVEQKSGEAISSTQAGAWVLGRDFDLPARLSRADQQLDRCEGAAGSACGCSHRRRRSRPPTAATTPTSCSTTRI